MTEIWEKVPMLNFQQIQEIPICPPYPYIIMRGFIFNIKFKITQPLVPPEKERKYNLVCIIEGKQRSRRLYPSETDKEMSMSQTQGRTQKGPHGAYTDTHTCANVHPRTHKQIADTHTHSHPNKRIHIHAQYRHTHRYRPRDRCTYRHRYRHRDR